MTDNHRPDLGTLELGGTQYAASSKWAGVRIKYRKAFAEFLGTAVLITFGCGAVSQLIFSSNSSWFIMTLGWGLGVTFGIYVAGGVSGAHLNPAVTLAQAIFRGFPLDEVLLYWVAQLLGAFVGAVIVFIINYHGFQIADRSSTIGIFVTGLQTDSVSTAAAFGAEFFGTAFLMLVILATSDEGNSPAGNIQPLIIGLLIVALCNSFGYQSGCALNPARDLAPRVFIALAGWGTEAFTRQAYYFWVPIVAPFAGAIAGALSYDVLVYSSRPSPLSN